MQNNFPKTNFFAALLMLFVLAGFFFYVYRSININNEEARLIEENLQNEISKREEMRTLDNSIKAIQPELQALEKHYVSASDIVSLLETLETLASKVDNQAEVTSVDVLKDNTGLLVNMKTSGSFQNIYKFLTLLENSNYELEILAMDIRKSSSFYFENKDIQIPDWNANFRIKILSFLP
jgi:Tfp pilus assembly protein PilN